MHDESDYKSELSKEVFRRVRDKRIQNAEDVQALEMFGFGVETANAKLEFFLDQLVEFGVLTEMQILMFSERWEDEFADQLSKMKQAVADAASRSNEQQAEQQAASEAPAKGLAIVKEAGVILGPGGQVLSSGNRD